ncbi:GPO family capsid scaffolding protein [Undibacterium umbellatum]|uniref:GPO family capsid scaffolding protein n=1 Tax=Undibacterium umbellatum TaxID=2762300 RepID=A0ABR6ZIR7_9BURK|nr:GPO family capsid scaffolding protein [Undibacterium umbellatum]MBC3911595.1 GPO family capsid scaffolding protein [Undibacterium umbellatum]
MSTKKFKSKFFRVALEGATTDGRKIERSWIQQMAKNFDPQKYGARIWMEHIRGTLADSPFRAYGDVTAVKAEEVTIDGDKKLALFAQIEPTDDLIAMTKAKQKIYTSIEINDKFADTGEAYLVGLGVTDSPASLGTEVLSFAANNPNANPFAGRKTNPAHLFSAAVEANLEFEEIDTEATGLAAKVKDLLKVFNSKKGGDNARFDDLGQAIETVVEHTADQEQRFSESNKRITELEKNLKTVTDNFNSLKTQLDKEPGNQTTRPTATGGNGTEQTDC